MSIEMIKPGLQTSIQDLGRWSKMHNGIAHSGAFDPVALQFANWLVGNEANHPALEITLVGPTIKFHCALSIAIVGAEFDLRLNGEPVFNNETITVETNDCLVFDLPTSTGKPSAKTHLSARAYLAFSADLDLPAVLGSYSTNLTASFGGFKGRALKSGDRLPLSKVRVAAEKHLNAKYQLSYLGNYLLRCTDSIESDWFTATEWQQFFSQSYRIAPESNRMGLRLSGEPLPLVEKAQLISSGLAPASIQIPPSGQPIISGVDGQTIGGYPRIGNVISADQNILGQLKAGDKVNFIYVTHDEAIELLKAKRTLLQRVKQSLS